MTSPSTNFTHPFVYKELTNNPSNKSANRSKDELIFDHKKKIIGTVALAILGIAGICSGYFLYNHFNSDPIKHKDNRFSDLNPEDIHNNKNISNSEDANKNISNSEDTNKNISNSEDANKNISNPEDTSINISNLKDILEQKENVEKITNKLRENYWKNPSSPIYPLNSQPDPNSLIFNSNLKTRKPLYNQSNEIPGLICHLLNNTELNQHTLIFIKKLEEENSKNQISLVCPENSSFAISKNSNKLLTKNDSVKFSKSSISNVEAEDDSLVSFSQSLFYPKSFESYSVYQIELAFYNEAKKINLHNLYKMNKQEREDVVKEFKLQDSINLLGGDSFFNKLAKVNKRILELANLVDLKIYSETSDLKYILLSDAEFNQLTLNELKDISPDQKHIIFERLKHYVKNESISDNELENDLLLIQNISAAGKKDDFKPITKIQINKFFNLNSEQINKFIDQIPESVVSLISNDQLKGLDFRKMSLAQISNLLNIFTSARVNALSSDQLESIFHQLNGWDTENTSYINAYRALILMNIQIYLSEAQFKQLNFTTLDGNLIQAFFDYSPSRVPLLTPSQISCVIHQLTRAQKYFLTEDQAQILNQLDYFRHNVDVFLSNMFNFGTNKPKDSQQSLSNDDQSKQLNLPMQSTDQIQNPLDGFSSPIADQTQSVFNLLKDEQLPFNTDNQFKQLDLTKLDANPIQLEDWELSLITDIQFKQLNFNALNDDQILKLLDAEMPHRIRLLPQNQLNSIFDQLNGKHMSYLTDDQLRSLDTSKLSQKQVDLLFESWSDEKLRQKDTFQDLLSVTEEEEQILILNVMRDEIKTKNEYRLSLFSDLQLSQIQDKLSEENRELISSRIQ